MKLSKYSEPILEKTGLDANCCKIIGEFAGNDVHMLRGEMYYVLETGKNTFVKTNSFNSKLGDNRHLHVFEIKRRTPCSYVTEYRYTLIICHSNTGVVFKFKTTFLSLKGLKRRFFPNRQMDVQVYLQEYANMNFSALPEKIVCEYRHGNFYVDPFEWGC